MDSPTDTSTEGLLKLVRELAGHKAARVLFWVVAIGAGVNFLPGLLSSIDSILERVRGTDPIYASICALLAVIVAGTLLGLYLRLRRKRPIEPLLAAPPAVRSPQRVLLALQPSPMARPLSDEVSPDVMQRFFTNR